MLQSKLWGQRACTAAQSLCRPTRVALFAALLLAASSGAAQTWTLGRAAPPLYQIIAIDRTGEPAWPYGREDVAGDGLDAFSPEESASDLRSLYADADDAKLWLRAYVVSAAEPDTNLTAYYFLDADDRASSGGQAEGVKISPLLTRDTSGGGYERAIAIGGDGALRGVWEWNEVQRDWVSLSPPANAIRGTRGRAPDLLGLGAPLRGYLQVEVEHAATGLNATCAARLLVRLVRQAGASVWVDDMRDDVTCRPALDSLGDPEIVRSYRCESDLECPASGRCRDGVCLFAYECARDQDCRSNERCTENRCVRAVDQSCSSSAQCDGLVCEAGRCIACAESGARACEGGRYCSPNGACVDPDDVDVLKTGRVQGGAFHCAADGGAASYAAWMVATLGLALSVRRAKRRAG